MRGVCKTVRARALLFAAGDRAAASPTMAFGYLANDSNDPDYEYLETIFPNSFANSIKNIFDVTVVKPAQINQRLEKYKTELSRSYRTYEVPEIMEKINTDFFIYGKFVPQPGNNILIVLNLYQRGSNMIFTFSNTGRMESEIFRLVDRITQILISLLDADELYKTEPVAARSRLAVITNLEGAELNALYAELAKGGFSISSVQGNTLYNHVDENMIEKFKYVYSENNSYDIITDRRKVQFLHGPWSGERYQAKVEEYKKIYMRYDMNYPETKKEILDTMSKTFNGSIDYLLIAGFAKNRGSAWVRCISMKNQNLMWMQSNISGWNVSSIGELITKSMSAVMKVPFEDRK